MNPIFDDIFIGLFSGPNGIFRCKEDRLTRLDGIGFMGFHGISWDFMGFLTSAPYDTSQKVGRC